jgi:hypothetical protein
MSKKPSLAESMRQAAQASEPLPPVVAPVVGAPKAAPQEPASKPTVAFHAATRVGKKKVTAPLTPEDHKRLRHLALDRDATTEALLVEAINDLFAKYGLTGAGQGAVPGSTAGQAKCEVFGETVKR